MGDISIFCMDSYLRSNGGKIHIYTGDGKGKTTAALGLVLRAVGAGKKCAVIFFDKGGTHYSERATLERLGVEWFAFGRDRIDPVTRRFDFSITDEDRVLGRAGLVKAEELFFPPSSAEGGGQVGDFGLDLLVLDEFCTSVGVKLLAEIEALALLDRKPSALELVLTGRNASDALRERADLVSRVTMEKHYLFDGMNAREGIDY